jgi:hypothetical protein
MPPERVVELAVEARDELKLRYAPLALVCEMTKSSKSHRTIVASTLERVIQSPKGIAEYVAIYWKLSGSICPLSKQSKIGLAAAFSKFTEHDFATCEDCGQVKLRDVLALVHAKPKSKDRVAPSQSSLTRLSSPQRPKVGSQLRRPTKPLRSSTAGHRLK